MQKSSDQQSILEFLYKYAQPQSTTPLIVLTGDVGTGKSLVLRMLARKLSMAFLNNPFGDARLPVTVPLQKFDLVSGGFWDEICKEWADWTWRLSKKGIRLDWLRNRLHKKPMVVIMDSVDEFMVRNRVTSDQMLQHLLSVRDKYNAEANVVLIVGVRSGEGIIPLLEEHADHVFRILRLLPRQAVDSFPGVGILLKRVIGENWSSSLEDGRDEDTRLVAGSARELQEALSLVLSPLVLRQISEYLEVMDSEEEREALVDEYVPDGSISIDRVLRLAIVSNVKKAGVLAYNLNGMTRGSLEWLLALSIVSMIYNSRNVMTMAVKSLTEEVSRLIMRWADHEWLDDRDLSLFKGAVEILTDTGARMALLQKTVFYPDGHDEFRFQHRIWYDYLLGEYCAFAFRVRNLGEAMLSSFSVGAHGVAGRVLSASGHFDVDRKFATQIAKAASRKYGAFVLGNLGAVIAKSDLVLDDKFLDEFAQRMHGFPESGRFVFLNALGVRALRTGTVEEDSDLREFLIKQFTDRLQQVTLPDNSVPTGTDRLAASMSWLYLARLSQILQNDAIHPDYPWPGLQLSDREKFQLIDGMHSEARGESLARGDDIPQPYRSCQKAFLTVQSLEYDLEHRAISLVHYLFALIVSCQFEVAIEEVKQTVPALISDRSFCDAFSLDGIPELAKAFAVCIREERKIDLKQ